MANKVEAIDERGIGVPGAALADPEPAGPEAQAVTVVRPSRGWQLINLAELWRFRELVFHLIWRDVKVRYKQTLLGGAWAVLQPACQMVVFTIFFGQIAKVNAGDLPYPLFVLAGLLPWNFFATAIAQSGNSVVNSEHLITKIYFPRLSIPLGAVGAGIVDFAVAFWLLVGLRFYYQGQAPITVGPTMAMAPVIFALIVVLALGVGTLFAALNVAYRDFRYVIPFVMQLWLFATPSIYMLLDEPTGQRAGLTGVVRAALSFNPMTGLIANFRSSLLGGPLDWGELGRSAAVVAAVFLAGTLYFRRVEDTFPDII